jgi:predicted chitinase
MMKLYTGVVENREDPLEIGRCQVRVVGLHTENKVFLPTADLPWAHPMTPITSASISGIGQTPVGPVNGTWVLIMFADEDQQQPIMLGTLPGIPQSKAAQIAIEESGLNVIATNGGILTDSSGVPVVATDGSPIQVGTKESVSDSGTGTGRTIVIDLRGQQQEARVKAYEDAIAAGKSEEEAQNISATVGNNVGADALSKINLDDETTYMNKSEVEAPDTTTSTTTPTSTAAKQEATAIPVPSSSGAKTENLDEQNTPNAPSENAMKKAIPIEPPPGSTPDPQKAKQNIQYLIDACEQVGLTSKYAKAAILGICGGESAWLPVEEGYYYTKAESLSAIFKRTFPTPESAKPYVAWKGTRAEFFKKVYGPEGNGSLVGNTQPNDGAMYYGRGFNGLTGRPGYLQIQNFLKSKGINLDLMNNPNSLIDDPKVAAYACAAFYYLNVKHDQNDPGYYTSALHRTGADANGTGYPKKQKYYEYFLGQAIHANPTSKPTADTDTKYTPEQVKDMPPSKQAAILEDRSDSSIVGFSDPTGKYPLRNLLDEPDTNRMARGVQAETAVEFKDARRSKFISAANDGDSWSQPLAPFGGKYPYCKVTETESGHLFIMDDTPNNETISLYHRTGTFLDIDGNGSQVNKIMGDGYTIIDRNGFIYVTGRANVTVGNGINILVEGAADIQVNGTSTINLKGKADIGVAGDLGLTVGGNFNLNVAKDFNVTANNLNTYVKNSAITTVVKDYNVNVAGTYNQTAKTLSFSSGSFNQKVSGAASQRFEGDWLKYYANTYDRFLPGSKSYTCPADGARSSSTDCKDVGGAEDAVKTTYLKTTPPEAVAAKANQFSNLTTPVRPSPPVAVKKEIYDQNDASVQQYFDNPKQFYNKEAEDAGVKPNRPPIPKSEGEPAQSLISGGETGDLIAHFAKQLQLTKETGYWRETGQNKATTVQDSNKNICRLWTDLGYPASGPYATDQTAWCMAFAQWSLKQCGYRYVQTGWVYDLRDKPDKWGATKVAFKDVQPGDMTVFKFGHIAFVYEILKSGNLTFVGGNQTPVMKGNNPNDGDVTIMYPANRGGWNPSFGDVDSFWRPSKK